MSLPSTIGNGWGVERWTPGKGLAHRFMADEPLPGRVSARTDAHLPDHPPCPHCGSKQTELVSPFGSVLANAQYRCQACSSPFEFMKWLPED